MAAKDEPRSSKESEVRIGDIKDSIDLLPQNNVTISKDMVEESKDLEVKLAPDVCVLESAPSAG